MDGFELSPAAVLSVADQWDEQHIELLGAADQVANAPVAGFSPGLTAAARGGCATWANRITATASACADQADAMRGAVRQVQVADDLAGVVLRALRSIA